eukprot:6492138-Amphidinium_carterae.1
MRFKPEQVFVNSQDSISPHARLVHYNSPSLSFGIHSHSITQLLRAFSITAVGSLQQRPGCKGSLGHCTEASSVDMDEMADFTPEAQQPQVEQQDEEEEEGFSSDSEEKPKNEEPPQGRARSRSGTRPKGYWQTYRDGRPRKHRAGKRVREQREKHAAASDRPILPEQRETHAAAGDRPIPPDREWRDEHLRELEAREKRRRDGRQQQPKQPQRQQQQQQGLQQQTKSRPIQPLNTSGVAVGADMAGPKRKAPQPPADRSSRHSTRPVPPPERISARPAPPPQRAHMDRHSARPASPETNRHRHRSRRNRPRSPSRRPSRPQVIRPTSSTSVSRPRPPRQPQQPQGGVQAPMPPPQQRGITARAPPPQQQQQPPHVDAVIAHAARALTPSASAEALQAFAQLVALIPRYIVWSARDTEPPESFARALLVALADTGGGGMISSHKVSCGSTGFPQPFQ